MKYSNLIIFLIFIYGCISKSVDSMVSCNLILDYGSNKLTVSIINNYQNVYLSHDNSLKIYKMDTTGEYVDWTDSFYQNSMALLQQKVSSSKSKLSKDHRIPKIELNKLEEKFIEKLKPLDSTEYLSIQEQIEIKLFGILLLNKMTEHQEVVDLYPLKYQGGCFKLVYNYYPMDHIVIGTNYFKLPQEIDVNKRLDVQIKSNETYICY